MPPFLRGVHQMSPPQQLRQQTSNCSSLLIYRSRKDERLSWPSWLTYSGWLTHQLQVERRTAKAHRPKTDSLPLDHATNRSGTVDLYSAIISDTVERNGRCSSTGFCRCQWRTSERHSYYDAGTWSNKLLPLPGWRCARSTNNPKTVIAPGVGDWTLIKESRRQVHHLGEVNMFFACE